MLQKKQIFKINVLKKLLTEEFSCVTLVRTNRLLAVPPCFLNDIKGGILFLLNNILKKYDRSLNGILIGFQNVKILLDENTGLVPMGVGETRVNISVEFYIFQPKIGGFLQGIVNKKSKNHIGCLVHCYFNATILKPDDVEYENWIGKNLNVKDKIKFKVKDLDFSGLVPCIEGTIEESVNNINFCTEPDGESISDTPTNCSNKKEVIKLKNSKKRKLKIIAEASSSNNTNVEENEEEENVLHSTQIRPCKKMKIEFCSPIQPETNSKFNSTKIEDNLHKKVKSKHKEKKKKKKSLEEGSKIDNREKKKKRKDSLSDASKSSSMSNSLKKSLPIEKSKKDVTDAKDDFTESLILKLQAEALENLNGCSSHSSVKIKKSKIHKKSKKSREKNVSEDLYSKLLSDAMNSINYSAEN